MQNSISRPLSTAGSSPLNQSLTSQGPIQSSGPSLNVDNVGVNPGIYSTVTPRRNHNTSVTIINSSVSQVINEYIKIKCMLTSIIFIIINIFLYKFFRE